MYEGRKRQCCQYKCNWSHVGFNYGNHQKSAIGTNFPELVWNGLFILTLYWLYFQPLHDDVIKWKYFPRYWPFVRGIHRSQVNSPHKGQWRGALILSLICAWINGWVNNREADDWRRHWAHNDVIVMSTYILNYSSRYIEWKCNYWRPQDELRCSPCWWHSNNWCVVSPYFNERYQMAQLRFTGDMADRNCVLHYQANMDMAVIMAT